MNKILSSLPKTIHTSLAISILLFLGLFFNNEGFDIDRIVWSWSLRYIHVVVAILIIGCVHPFFPFLSFILSFIFFFFAL